MPLLNPSTSYIRAPQGMPSVSQALEHKPSVQVVLLLKSRPPINFNLALKEHAMQHGMVINDIGFHYHPTGNKISVKLGGALENAQRFADSAVAKFGTYVSRAEVGAANQGIFRR